MKAYFLTTAIIFALLTVAHIWRMVAEQGWLARNPWVVVATLLTAALSIWGFSLFRRTRGTGDRS